MNEVGGKHINELVTKSEGPNTLILKCHAMIGILYRIAYLLYVVCNYKQTIMFLSIYIQQVIELLCCILFNNKGGRMI